MVVIAFVALVLLPLAGCDETGGRSLAVRPARLCPFVCGGVFSFLGGFTIF